MKQDPERVVMAMEGTGHREWVDERKIPAPLRLFNTPVLPAWVDYNQHMSESSYLLVCGHNADAFFRYIGIGEEHREQGFSLYTLQTNLLNLAECAEGDELELTLAVIDSDHKRVHIVHRMWNTTTGSEAAVCEQLLIYVDAKRGVSTTMPGYLADRIRQIQQAHASLPQPDIVGQPIGIRRT